RYDHLRAWQCPHNTEGRCIACAGGGNARGLNHPLAFSFCWLSIADRSCQRSAGSKGNIDPGETRRGAARFPPFSVEGLPMPLPVNHPPTTRRLCFHWDGGVLRWTWIG